MVAEGAVESRQWTSRAADLFEAVAQWMALNGFAIFSVGTPVRSPPTGVCIKRTIWSSSSSAYARLRCRQAFGLLDLDTPCALRNQQAVHEEDGTIQFVGQQRVAVAGT